MEQHKDISEQSVKELPSLKDVQMVLQCVGEKEYGEKYREHVLEQYKLYLELTDNISSRRQKANTFYLTVNTTLVTVAGFLAGLSNGGAYWPIAIGLAGLILCYTWYRLILSYRDLNKGKFLVVHALENLLPTQPYKAEWITVGEGKNPKLFLLFTHVEAAVPWVFFALYVVLLLLKAAEAIWPLIIQ